VVVLAVAHPWASASSYVSFRSPSPILAATRSKLHATFAVVPLSSFSLLSLHPLSRRSPLPRSAAPPLSADPLLSRLFLGAKRKKENRQPKGGMGGRHAATTQGF